MSAPINPYQPPAAECTPAIFKARYLSRDLVDWFLSALIGVPVGVLFVGGGACAGFVLGFEPAIGVFASLAPVILHAMSGIESASFGSDSLQLRRFTGGIIEIPWESLISVRPATRWEAVRAYLLRPHLACTGCGSFRDQFRLDWAGRWALFAPRDPQAFAEAVQTFRTAATRTFSETF